MNGTESLLVTCVYFRGVKVIHLLPLWIQLGMNFSEAHVYENPRKNRPDIDQLGDVFSQFFIFYRNLGGDDPI